MDMVANECDRLVSGLQEVKDAKDAIDEKSLEWLVAYEVHVEYINNLAFILGHPIDKLPSALAVEITTLPGEVMVGVEPTIHLRLKVTIVMDIATLAVDTHTHKADNALTNTSWMG